MSKKHFIALADVIKLHNSFEFNTPYTLNQIGALARFCKTQNPRFNEPRWLDYIAGTCGPNGGKRKRDRP